MSKSFNSKITKLWRSFLARISRARPLLRWNSSISEAIKINNFTESKTTNSTIALFTLNFLLKPRRFQANNLIPLLVQKYLNSPLWDKTKQSSKLSPIACFSAIKFQTKLLNPKRMIIHSSSNKRHQSLINSTPQMDFNRINTWNLLPKSP